MTARADVLAPEKRTIATRCGYEVRYRAAFDVQILSQPHAGSASAEGLSCAAGEIAKRWRVKIALGKLSVILRELPKGHIQLDTGARQNSGRMSTGTSDLNDAIAYAEEYLTTQHLAELGRQDVAAAVSVAGHDLTLGEATLLCQTHYLPSLTATQGYDVERALKCALAIFGPGYPLKAIGQSFVKQYIEWRTNQELFLKHWRGRKRQVPCGHVTALKEIKYVASALRSLRSVETPNHARLLREDPFMGVVWPSGPEYQKRLREPLDVELYAWLMSPFTDPATGIKHPPPVDVIDPSGALRWYVACLYHLGHRREALRNLFARDVLLDVQSIRERLRSARGAASPSWAPAFAVNGAIWLDPKYSKCDYARVVPMSSAHRAEWDYYCERHGPWLPSDALIPSCTRPTVPMSEMVLHRQREVKPTGRVKSGGRYVEAIHRVRDHLRSSGLDPDELAPIGHHELVHGWRNCFATRLERLGWGRAGSQGNLHLDRHVDYYGGWTILGHGVREERYVKLDGYLLVAVAENRSAGEVLQVRGGDVAAQLRGIQQRVGTGLYRD